MSNDQHRPRHRALDQDDIETRMIPRIRDDQPPADAGPAAPLTMPVRPAAPVPPVVPLPLVVAAPMAAPAAHAVPAATDAADATAYIPRFTEQAETTTVLPKIPANPESTPKTTPEDEPEATQDPDGPKGVKVVPLRPVRTQEGYRSVYSEYTRTTFGTVVRAVSRGTGELLITFGLIVLLFAGYEVWGKSAIVDAHQDELNRQLEQQWAQPAADPTVAPSGPPSPVAKPANGAVIASVHIPRLKKKWAVVQGVTPADIRYAPGHYPDTALPGQVGNFSMAGHRTPAIWWDLDQLKANDPVVVKTADTWYVYRVTSHEIVLPTAVQVVAPVPNKPGVAPTKAMLTMTTCNPKFNNYQRLVVHAELDRTQPVAQGDPAELKG
ncbi:class E sortase [Dactylosporangium sp. NPDC050688]|uniref:class E sortase n=1 Tax=Dactylosporangium sp. NPDC050688 TaxID=3157217 RepID=UPI0033FEBE9A